ncbi:hypothetical protein COL516b_008246 [Colletotrichum fioriniae]|nr:uncharacterized protein COL516b_008246 [Colletotrichum fioriniae]KAJ0300675.1 hypothetical protein COL516b_008246 [Colletotrichum fioriniae]
MEVPHSGFAPNYGASGSGQASMDQGTHEPTDQERRDSILQASRRKSKRSMNKPNVKLRQANISDSSQSGQAGDKKRNKLGYHRTSVACVDQAPSQTTEARPKPQPRPAGGSNTGSASSSPVVLPGQALEGSQHYQHHQEGVLPSSQNVLPTIVQTSAADNLGQDPTVPDHSISVILAVYVPSPTASQLEQRRYQCSQQHGIFVIYNREPYGIPKRHADTYTIPHDVTADPATPQKVFDGDDD